MPVKETIRGFKTIIDGEMVRGGAQDIYFCEFDGPAKRTVLVIVEGE